MVRVLLILIRQALPERGSMLKLVAVVLAMGAGVFGLESACYPWAYSITFGRTLTGTWVGELAAPVRGPHVVFIDLRDANGDDGTDRTISGRAKICDARGQTHEFGLSGAADNWRGTRFHVSTFIVENRDGDGVQLGRADGLWDRADTIRVTAKLLLFRIRGGGTFSSTDRSPDQVALEDTPVTVTLRRATDADFRAACEGLRARPHG